MEELTLPLEMIKLNTVLCSMEIGKSETIDLTIPETNKLLSQQDETIEIFDDFDLDNIGNFLVQDVPKQRRFNRSRRRRTGRVSVSVSELSQEMNVEEPDVIAIDEPMNVEDSSVLSINSTDLSTNFVNCNKRRVMNNSVLDETSLLCEEKTDELENEVSAKENTVESKRTLRKRVRQVDNQIEDPTKVKIKKPNSVEKYYLNKKVKRLPPTLETIFEEPKQENNQELYIGARKLKRVLSFHEDIVYSSKLKSRKRLNKAKKLPLSKKFINRKKVSMETLMGKLQGLDSDE